MSEVPVVIGTVLIDGVNRWRVYHINRNGDGTIRSYRVTFIGRTDTDRKPKIPYETVVWPHELKWFEREGVGQ